MLPQEGFPFPVSLECGSLLPSSCFNSFNPGLQIEDKKRQQALPHSKTVSRCSQGEKWPHKQTN
jgi:hypothetical protein